MTHVAESTHWYDRRGNPAYEVPAAKGGMRPTTLRDARRLALVPSVTTVIKCAAAPGLEMWKANQLMMAALTLPRLQGESEKDWLARVSQDSKETAKKAADRGTAIHAAIQGFYDDETPTTGFEPYILGADQAVREWAPACEEWKAERSFASSMGFGGKVDLSAFDDGTGFILDFKTKEFDQDDDLKTWDEHAMQLAAYREGLAYPNARCAIVYVSVTVPGLVRLIELDEENIKQGWSMFYSLLHYWQAKNGYRSAFTREETLVA